MQAPRFVPDLPLPPYSYVTGRSPHPLRDPKGHSYGHQPVGVAPLDPREWRKSREYLYAVDLFNYGYYWEAHEEWEGLWHACGRTGVMADFLKGLIKLAAAGVKVREGRPDGVRRHAMRAEELFGIVAKGVAPEEKFCGLDLGQLVEFSRRLQQSPPTLPAVRQPVEIVFDFCLAPQ
jgi:hypothetical protein